MSKTLYPISVIYENAPLAVACLGDIVSRQTVIYENKPKVLNWRLPNIVTYTGETLQTPDGLDLETPEGETLEAS